MTGSPSASSTPTMEEGVVGHGGGARIVETLTVLSRHPRRVTEPGEILPHLVGRRTVQPVDRRGRLRAWTFLCPEARRRARADPAVLQVVVRHLQELRGLVVAPASPWLARRHATLARTWAR